MQLLQVNSNTIPRVVEAMLAIDMLLPVEAYIAEVLQVVCVHLGFAAGGATIGGSDDAPRVVSVGRKVVADDATLATLIAEGEDDAGAYCDDVDIRRIIRLPLIYAGRMLGWCALFDDRWDAPAPEEARVLEAIAEMAAVTVACNDHLAQLQTRSHELREEIARGRRVEASLREALCQRWELEQTIDRSPMVVLSCRGEGDWPVDYVSASLAQFGYVPADFCGNRRTLADLLHPADRDRVMRALTHFAHGEQEEYALECRVATCQGEARWVEGRFWRHVEGPNGAEPVRVRGLLHDTTERRLAEETMRHQAFHDVLTDLPNRQLFHDRLSAAISRARRHGGRLAVMFIDIDNFKAINDTLGHAAGDELLILVAQRLQLRLRDEDTVARMGGDEFTVLLPEVCHVGDAAYVAEKVLQALQSPVMLGGYEFHVSGSIGLALFPDDGHDAAALLRSADTALYHAKDGGRNTYTFYHPNMNARTLERLQLENDLRYAVERGQLLLHYQPKVSVATRQIVGMEALVRWQHPTLGMVPPSQFIPLANDTGLIEPIGEWVLREACRQAQHWQADGSLHALPVAVNLSGRQFQHHHLPDLVASVLADAGLDPALLELEITESVAMRNVEISVSMMRALRAQGVQLSLDDFGVGYSSLISLKQFPITTLKIDQHFVRGIASDPVDSAIVRAVISMGQSLGVQVVAEGVETEEQLAVLRSCHCDSIQGYLVSKPVGAGAAAGLLRTPF